MKFTKVSRAVGNGKSHFLLTIHWNVAKPVIAHQGFTDLRRMVLLKERCAELKKELLLYCCNLAWRRNGALIPRNVAVICEMFKTSYRTGKHLVNGALENHLKEWLFLSDQ